MRPNEATRPIYNSIDPADDPSTEIEWTSPCCEIEDDYLVRWFNKYEGTAECGCGNTFTVDTFDGP